MLMYTMGDNINHTTIIILIIIIIIVIIIMIIIFIISSSSIFITYELRWIWLCWGGGVVNSPIFWK